jgi:predicted RNA-binding protein YlxR (DUF448 family)
VSGAKKVPHLQEGDGKDPSLRLCAVTRSHQAPEDLVRFVADPSGTILPDLTRRLPGRGVWIGARHDLVAAGVRQKVFARTLRREVSAPEDLPGLVARLMKKRLMEAVSLANKAGLLVAGFAKVSGMMEQKRVVLLIHAADAAADGVAKLDRKFKALMPDEADSLHIVTDLAGAELDLAMGRSNVVHAAASAGGASQRIVQEAVRLERYLSESNATALANAIEADTGRA